MLEVDSVRTTGNDIPQPSLDATLESRLHGGLYLLLQQLRARPVARFMRRLALTEALAPVALQGHIREKLSGTLALARDRVPYYGSGRWEAAFRARDPREIRSWPVLERHDLANHFAALHVRRAGPLDANRRSSATTGGGVRVSMHCHAAAWQWAWEHHVMGLHGFPLGTPALVLWGGGITPFQNWVRNRTFFSTTDLTIERLDAATDAFLDGGVKAVWTYPSAAFQLARHVAARGAGGARRLPFVKVGGEPLFAFQRREIERHLGRRVINFYGASEVGPVAAECPSGSMHVFSENLHLEILQGDDPVRVGELGDLVLTPLTNPVMPLVRYRIGDRARLAPEPCPCGSPRPVLAQIQSRREETFLAADGSRRHISALIDGVADVVRRAPPSALRQVAFQHHGGEGWTVFVEGTKGASPSVQEGLRALVRREVGPRADVRVRWTSLIPREKSGKFRLYRADVSGSTTAAVVEPDVDGAGGSGFDGR